jgi:hypothetical protein
MNRRIISAAAVTLAAAVLLTGCAGNQDKDAVSKVALQASDTVKGQTKQVAGVWQKDSGYTALVRIDGKNGTGKYSNWDAYSLTKKGDSWAIKRSEPAYDDDNPTKTPHKATCRALAQTDEEKDQCSALTD